MDFIFHCFRVLVLLIAIVAVAGAIAYGLMWCALNGVWLGFAAVLVIYVLILAGITYR